MRFNLLEQIYMYRFFFYEKVNLDFELNASEAIIQGDQDHFLSK